MSTLPSVLLINYIHLQLASCSRTFISNAVLPVYFSHVLPVYLTFKNSILLERLAVHVLIVYSAIAGSK